jgi:pantetheine-phosphate adenylyltransferase/16S rRNA (guanine(966)-N(2))-methyltransferase RsmD
MRVIAGSAKGRRLRAGRGLAVRPTADKVKGALFNILASRFVLESAQVLDLFAGSGNLGIEALSRGAGSVTFVEQSATAVRVLRDNLKLCGFDQRSRILQLPVARALTQLSRASSRFDGVFIDPPYGKGLVDDTLRQLAPRGLIRPGGWVIVEHHTDESPAPTHGTLRLTQARRYGKTGVALFVASEPMPTSQADEKKSIRAVYAGSFDPITNGHLDVVRRALQVFDQVIVAVAAGTSDPHKDRAFFTAEERVAMIREALADTGGRAIADSFTGLLVDYCEKIGARVIIRGLRAVSDFEYEFQMAMMNRHLKPHIETFFMTASVTYFYTASRLVKEVAKLGGDVSELLPNSVHQRLLKKLRSAP